MPHRPPRGLRALTAGIKLATATLIVAMGVGLGHHVGDDAPALPSAPVGADRSVDRAIERHQCSTTGFANEATPQSALVRIDGRLRHVPFDRGWAVFTGDRAGALVALCLADPPSVGSRRQS